jgi:porphobilinogen synthase
MALSIRPRRLRRNPIIREMVVETQLNTHAFVYPYFVTKGAGIKSSIESMPNIYHFSPDTLVKDVEESLKLGLNKVLLFGVGDEKTEDGSSAYDFKSAVATATRRLKAEFGNDIYIINDVCACAYTSHGHCGILENEHVNNDKTLQLLAQTALTYAEAGADMVAPSDMMDGRVATIRQTLDENNFEHTAILSYAVKFASAYYGPFRDAADSSPSKGDRKGYQMDFRNSRESLKEALLDEQEGADMLMVKPALAYLDIIQSVKENTLLPLACYNVSGEYSMLKLAAEKGIVDEKSLVMENMFAFARAGADIIISYHAKDILKNGWL